MSKNLNLVSNVYMSFKDGNMDAILSSFADDIQWFEMEGERYGGHFSGPEAILENVSLNNDSKSMLLNIYILDQ